MKITIKRANSDGDRPIYRDAHCIGYAYKMEGMVTKNDGWGFRLLFQYKNSRGKADTLSELREMVKDIIIARGK